MTETFYHRLATHDDIPAIMALMDVTITVGMRNFLSDAEIVVARQSMGIDTTLIDDGTYFLIETPQNQGEVLVACGGWGKRRTLYGGDATQGRDDRFADPETEPARIRAMYTHPDWTRRGIGTLLLRLGEEAARAAGFRTIELGSTVPGVPLYEARGYVPFFKEEKIGGNGKIDVITHMRKSLRPPPEQ